MHLQWKGCKSIYCSILELETIRILISELVILQLTLKYSTKMHVMNTEHLEQNSPQEKENLAH